MGVWAACEWHALGRPPALRLVELGPGRGTLMADLLRGTATLAGFAPALRVHLVEVSPRLRQAQWEALKCRPLDGAGGEGEEPPDRGVSALSGTVVAWHRSLDAVPASGPPALYLAHEFFDALPVHQFVRVVPPARRGPRRRVAGPAVLGPDGAPVARAGAGAGAAGVEADGGEAAEAAGTPSPNSSTTPVLSRLAAWRERLVDVAPPGAPTPFRFVLAPHDTPASRTLLPHRLAGMSEDEQRGLTGLEVCPQGMALAADLAARVATGGGSALVVDYGRANPPYADSLAAIRAHAPTHLLARPGEADVSARVDFSALRQAVAGAGVGAGAHGPVPQASFLMGLGLEARLQALEAAAAGDEAAVHSLRVGAWRLVAGHVADADEGSEAQPEALAAAQGGGGDVPLEGMGQQYQAFAISPASRPPPVPFPGCAPPG